MVGGTGFEPVTSAMWTQRSKPAELTARKRGKINQIKVRKQEDGEREKTKDKRIKIKDKR